MFPFSNCLREIFPSFFPKMPSLCVLADGQNKLNLRHLGHDPFAPEWSALSTRRQIASLLVVTREAKAHRHDGELRRIVKGCSVYTHPIAQAVSRTIVKGQSGCMHAHSRRLAGDQNAGFARRDHNGSWFMRERRSKRPLPTDPAGSNILKKPFQRIVHTTTSYKLHEIRC